MQIRKEAKVNQSEIAKALGVSQAYVSMLERGENYFDVIQFAQWCMACGNNPGAVMNEVMSFQDKPKIEKTE